ncbi:hypothetical protein [Paraburkholderia sp. 40]|uniref:hypothetical protein n=1 Tax=Paraburkholderia sp. 40 TaxID=2991059 RepID=UPI003D1F03BA
MNTSFVNPLPGVPDVESPFFDELFAQKEASENVLRAARQLRENGFAIIDFPDAEFDARAERIKTKFHGRFDFDHWRGGCKNFCVNGHLAGNCQQQEHR